MKQENLSTTALRVFRALIGHEGRGISCQEIADGLGLGKTAAYRDLRTIEAAGFAEQLPNKKWRVAPAFGREALKIIHSLQEDRRRLEELERRYGLDSYGADDIQARFPQ